jgi:thymidylate synthase (FAD)
MPKIVEPEVFLIAETALMPSGMRKYLEAIGAKGWSTLATSDAEELCEVAGKSCYMSFNTDLNKNLTRTGTRSNHEYVADQIVKQKHGSVLEHSSVTLAFVNVSRVFTHELVRHRAGAAYSQVSGRYVRTDEIGYFVPTAIKQQVPAAEELFFKAFSQMEQWQKELSKLFDIDNMKDFTLKKTLTSAFRRLIGNGQANHIIATFNHRALRNIIEMRTNRAAEEEIRLAFLKVFVLVSNRYPSIYGDALVKHEPGDNLSQVVFTYSKV